MIASCENEPQRNASADANAAQPQPVPVSPIPVPQPPLDREQLLLAAFHAASAFAAGADDSSRQKALADKKFEFRIRFGCGEAAAKLSDPFGWSYADSTKVLRVRATPTLSGDDAPVEAMAKGFEDIEGFWIRKPWLLSPVCLQPTGEPSPTATESGGKSKTADKPTTAPEAKSEAAPEVAQTVGIAQFFTATDPRTMRRSGRPYEATKRLDEGEKPKGGFDLVLTGRLKALPDGRVIVCTRQAAAGRPSCVISVEFGKVAIERTDTHEQIAQWGSG